MRRRLAAAARHGKDLYERPANLFVASLLGSPPMNLLGCRLVNQDGRYICEIGDQRAAVPEVLSAKMPRIARYADRDIVIGIRPEDISDKPNEGHGTVALRARAERMEKSWCPTAATRNG